MNLVYAAGIAAMMGCGLFLMLSRQIMRIVFGVMLLSASVNLTIFLAGRIGPNPPPVMRAGETVLEVGAANPLPQALVLTAIVIGFSLVAFVAALALQTFRSTGTLDSRELDQAENLGTPEGKGARR
ncbi:TPA: NADH-quinone oxidoreductase subunit K [Pseudomonas aeruginosa]|uniref:NADH-quinone oxidoreductase subunit K n=1 Tax=Pseudomonas aeruginosa TaxID=287 RepID=UPI0005B4EC50|nr:NADH-quinone oxidoreductase subunit K [Pseudomonas aeruginosa]MBG3944243.1 NADH-quinone oxidoreductase subunit K [Pseudomonas aeruginosa]MBG5635404.1 NADH-quinone oxidoreductase subunit K [Pseudomonas aeruginosa]MBG6973608.1 NADH-quinone oxidoreductase subunit K [Pseudomonas aeruginosa]MBG7548728.1 NADH-quinone oxidoreductase subunit K [Pseudomonas aeruginosa]MCU9029192.1 NADH-quinone oxidoreductase subunit K [Pseudomonas aeruginosa]